MDDVIACGPGIAQYARQRLFEQAHGLALFRQRRLGVVAVVRGHHAGLAVGLQQVGEAILDAVLLHELGTGAAQIPWREGRCLPFFDQGMCRAQPVAHGIFRAADGDGQSAGGGPGPGKTAIDRPCLVKQRQGARAQRHQVRPADELAAPTLAVHQAHGAGREVVVGPGRLDDVLDPLAAGGDHELEQQRHDRPDVRGVFEGLPEAPQLGIGQGPFDGGGHLLDLDRGGWIELQAVDFGIAAADHVLDGQAVVERRDQVGAHPIGLDLGAALPDRVEQFQDVMAADVPCLELHDVRVRGEQVGVEPALQVPDALRGDPATAPLDVVQEQVGAAAAGGVEFGLPLAFGTLGRGERLLGVEIGLHIAVGRCDLRVLVGLAAQLGQGQARRARVLLVHAELEPDFAIGHPLTKVGFDHPRRPALEQQRAEPALVLLVGRLGEFSLEVAHLPVGNTLVVLGRIGSHFLLPVLLPVQGCAVTVFRETQKNKKSLKLF